MKYQIKLCACVIISMILMITNAASKDIKQDNASTPETQEWVVVLKGEAIIAFEDNKEVHLTPGSYINILMHKKHKVLWTKPDTETIWLAIYYK